MSDWRERYPEEKAAWTEETAHQHMRTLIIRDPKVVWQIIRGRWEVAGEYNTPRECLADVGFTPKEVDELMPLVEKSAKDKFSRLLCQFIRDHPGEIFARCREVEMILPELAAAIGMPFEELDRITDEYFGGSP